MTTVREALAELVAAYSPGDEFFSLRGTRAWGAARAALAQRADEPVAWQAITALERERCACVCEDIARQYREGGRGHAAERAANAIRLLAPAAPAAPAYVPLPGEIAYQLTKRLVIDMPTARAAVDAAIESLVVARMGSSRVTK